MKLEVIACIFACISSTVLGVNETAITDCKCWIMPSKRKPCGVERFLSQEECEIAGCCYSSQSLQNATRCFQAKEYCHQLPQCQVQPRKRRPCPYSHHSTRNQHCQFKGCCHDPNNIPACFQARSNHDGKRNNSDYYETKGEIPIAINDNGTSYPAFIDALNNIPISETYNSLQDAMNAQLTSYEESVAHKKVVAVSFEGRKTLVLCPYESTYTACGHSATTELECISRRCCWNPLYEIPCIHPRIFTIPANDFPQPLKDEELTPTEIYEFPKEEEVIPSSGRGSFIKTCVSQNESRLCRTASSNRESCERNICCWLESSGKCLESRVYYQHNSTAPDTGDFTKTAPLLAVDMKDNAIFLSKPSRTVMYGNISLTLTCSADSGYIACEYGVSRNTCLSLFCCWKETIDGRGVCFKPVVKLDGKDISDNSSNVTQPRNSEWFSKEDSDFWRPSLPEVTARRDHILITTSCNIVESAEHGSCGGLIITSRKDCVSKGCCWRPWKMLEPKQKHVCVDPAVVITYDYNTPSRDVSPQFEDNLPFSVNNFRWKEWTEWSGCKHTSPCSPLGEQTRMRVCSRSADVTSNAGIPLCIGAESELMTCDRILGCDRTSWSAWSDWSDCSNSCQLGTKTRNRICQFTEDCQSQQEKADMIFQHDTQPCNTQMCGKWGPWMDENDCNAECESFGNAIQSRNCLDIPSKSPRDSVRKSNVLPPTWMNFHPENCYKQNVLCRSEVECVYKWDDWTEWTECDNECVPGKKSRQRRCLKSTSIEYVETKSSDCTGHIGEDSQQDIACGEGRCQVWGKWIKDGKCNAKCDELGTVSMKRICETGGSLVTSMYEEHCLRKNGTCMGSSCQNGIWGKWSKWSDCSSICSVGSQQRRRHCFSSLNGAVTDADKCIGETKQDRPCNLKSCRRWGEWKSSDCDAWCGALGEKVMSRDCLYHELRESEIKSIIPISCHLQKQACIKTCIVQWGEWNNWSQCSNKCSPGVRKRTRLCYREDGAPLDVALCLVDGGEKLEQEPCNSEMCSQWSLWDKGECEGLCNRRGVRKTNRYCIGNNQTWTEPSDNKLKSCYTKTAFCKPKCGRWGRWSDYGKCSDDCGPGKMIRRQQCVLSGLIVHNSHCMPPQRPTYQEKDCNVFLCSSYSPWEESSRCNGTCGEKNGTQVRRRYCHLGTAPDHCLISTVSCRPHCGAEWGSWSDWSTCNEKCGPGYRKRSRACSNGANPSECFAANDSEANIKLENQRQIKEEKCHVNYCKSWTKWSGTFCPAKCNQTGAMRRKRSCLDKSFGTIVPAECWSADFACIGACAASWSQWIPWTSCTSQCGPGTQVSVRRCTRNAKIVNPQECEERRTPTAVRRRQCNTALCETWSKWTVSPCTVKCGGAGVAIKQRVCLGTGSITNPSDPDDTSCYRREEICGTDFCDRSYMPWTEWSECSRLCSPGEQRRTRKCVTGGFQFGDCSDLGPSVDSRACNDNMCNRWKPWESSECYGGLSRQTRACEEKMSESLMRDVHPKECYAAEIACGR